MILEIGKYAQQATAAVLARTGDTVVHATVMVGPENLNLSYLPLSVEYQEKLYAGGKIKGSRWVKREGRPTDESILTARLIDRSVRPLFPKSLRREIQVVVTTLSVDGENDPDMPAMTAVAAAMSLSGLSFDGPVGSVRMGYIEKDGKGEFLTNPTHAERQKSSLDLVVSGNHQGILMVEAGANQVSEETILEALKQAQKEILTVVKGIEELAGKAGAAKVAKVEKNEAELAALKGKVAKTFNKEIEDLVAQMATKESHGGMDELIAIIMEKFAIEEQGLTFSALDQAITDRIRAGVLEKGVRPDGRKADEIRPITCRVSELPRTHGSAVFQRGTTQALTIVTLAPPSQELWIESPEADGTKRYIHHYNMPPFSVGEVGRMGWPSRREIGHGALAERALVPVIPSGKEFPYMIRVVSEIMSSNGSTSMASVCGSTLSLMDAGVPLKAPVAGIAMGLVMDKSSKGEKYVILSDIMGIEDFNGDMDFKVAGTKDGITALQMDVKVPGIGFEILEKALKQALTGRMFILGKMLEVMPEPRKLLSRYAPKINVITIDKEKIGDIIGPGGKMIKRISAENNVTVDVEDDGTVTVSGVDQAGMDKALEWIKSLTQSVKIGEEYEGTIVRIVDFGVFVNLIPGKDGLVHVSKLAKGYVNHPSELVSEGDKMLVKVESIDEQGRVSLLPVNPMEAPAGGGMPPVPPRSGGFSNGRGGGDRRGGDRRSSGSRDDRGGFSAGRRRPYYER